MFYIMSEPHRRAIINHVLLFVYRLLANENVIYQGLLGEKQIRMTLMLVFSVFDWQQDGNIQVN